NYDSPAEQRIYINGPSYTISNSATMERAGYGTSSSFARIIFEYPGTVTYFRNLAHTIQQCKQSIKSGCTVNVTSGPFQLSSHAATQLDMLTIEAGAVLSMGLHQLVSDTVHAHCGLTLQDNARLRISRTQGLYDGTANAAISSRGGMNYFLGAGSTVEYNTTTYARVTGINVGMANLPQHKYGILEINHTGAAGTWVSPTYLPGFTNAVYIRTKLIMTAGEFNLADAGGNPASGGRWVMIENPSPSALVRNGGYIRSEAMDHSARIVWTINAVAGTYLIPWGYSAAEYIPLTYQLTGGSAGTVSFSTYRTPPSNLPWPVGVNNLASHIGLTPDNRSATVDRFWRMAQTGSAPVLNLSFNYAGIELPGLPYNSPALMRAHAYNTSTNRWLAALPGQAASAYTVSVPSAGGQTHWALASMNAPLPLEWVSMQAEKDGAHVAIRWTTLSEKDCDFFTVCKSLDGINFEALTSTPASGNTGSLNAYLIYDYHAASKKGYYRIAETDLNGEVHWSEVFNYSPAEAGIDFFVWKDPVSQLHLLKFPDAEPGTLFIYHSDGRLLFSEPLVSGSPFTLPTQLKTGEAYIIRFLNPYTSYSLKCGF
ncbi:MAG: hypothetical protein JNL88_07670, partial [Bacteroidia bacterium]|nr:hypothetical protein [Bacteroidia bacterium]